MQKRSGREKEKVNQDSITTQGRKSQAPAVRMGISTVIGTRRRQQDTVFGFSRGSYHIAVVCDGMGGLNAGEVASKTATEILAQDFLEFEGREEEIPEFLHSEAKKLDEAVHGLTDEDGERLEAGTTIVAVMITGNQMYWMSVGDSRIFYVANNRIFSITREHNYRLSLDILRNRGTISDSDYEAELERGEALISYLGIGNLSLVDGNREAIRMERGDMILLCSDGLYKCLEAAEILEIMRRNDDVQEAANALTQYSVSRARGSQDNTSVVLIKYI